jgi:translation initiation factor IF-3
VIDIARDHNFVNEDIRANEVRVIDSTGEQLGIMNIKDALEVASSRGMDLVLVAKESIPPVCRIMDYGKYKYSQSKKQQVSKKHQKIIKVKEIKMRPKIEEHDYRFKTAHITRFLNEGNKAKVTIMFRGREMIHPHLGKGILDRVASQLEDISEVEQKPKMEGRRMSMVLTPKKGSESHSGGKNAED